MEPLARTTDEMAVFGCALSLIASCRRAGEAPLLRAIVCDRLSWSVCWPIAVLFSDRNGASRFATLALVAVVLTA
jgi:hypothetical protein